MTYYESLGLKTEPFSTSPDPAFFYETVGHKRALNNLLIELNLRRGISVILGDIGTGKTTLSRKLIQELSVREGFIFHIILDPDYQDKRAFLEALVQIFNIKIPAKPVLSEGGLEDAIKGFLFEQGVTENKTVVLIIDEAQKLSETSLEVLRILLNYETNTDKLLQLILLGQLELYPKLEAIPNLIDRVSFKYILSPFNQDETREMINFRLKQAGCPWANDVFTDGAVKKIYRYSQGYPRQIALLCHNALKYIIAHNQRVVNKNVIKKVRNEAVVGWSLTGKTTRLVPMVSGAKSKITSAQRWRYALLFSLLFLLLGGGIVWLVINRSHLKPTQVFYPPSAQENRIESFYKTTVEELKEEQARLAKLIKEEQVKTANLIAELIKSRDTQSSAKNEELFRHLKELEMAQEMMQKRVMALMEETTKMQSQVSGENKELGQRLAKLREDFNAFNSELSRLIPTVFPTRGLPEGKPQSGFYIIRILNGFIASADWQDNDPGTKSAPPDCFLVVYQNDKQIFRSKVKLDTRSPSWEEEFGFNWEKDAILEVILYDVDAEENEKILSWDNRKDKEFLFKGKSLTTPQGSYLNYEVFTIPLKKED